MTSLIRASWDWFPTWNTEIHGSIVPGRLALCLGNTLGRTNRLVLRWTFVIDRVPWNLHHTARPSNRRWRRGARVRLWWCGRKHVKGLRGRTVIASEGRRGSFCRRPILMVRTLGCGLAISSRFHGLGGLRWVILAAGPIYWAKVICHRILVAGWGIIKYVT